MINCLLIGYLIKWLSNLFFHSHTHTHTHRYHYLVLLFSKEVDLNMQLSISEEDLQNKYAGKLKSNMNGPEHEVGGDGGEWVVRW